MTSRFRSDYVMKRTLSYFNNVVLKACCNFWGLFCLFVFCSLSNADSVSLTCIDVSSTLHRQHRIAELSHRSLFSHLFTCKDSHWGAAQCNISPFAAAAAGSPGVSASATVDDVREREDLFSSLFRLPPPWRRRSTQKKPTENWIYRNISTSTRQPSVLSSFWSTTVWYWTQLM